MVGETEQFKLQWKVLWMCEDGIGNWEQLSKFLVSCLLQFGIIWRLKDASFTEGCVNRKLDESLKATKLDVNLQMKQWEYALRNIWKELSLRPGIEPGSLRFSLQVLYPLSYRSFLLIVVPFKPILCIFNFWWWVETDQFRCLQEVLRDMWGR